MDREEWLNKVNNINKPKDKDYGVVDVVFDILELPVNITASAVDLLHDGKMDRKFLDNTFSAMLSDHQKKQGKQMGIGDHITGFAMDMLLDPTTYFGIGIFSKINKLDEAFKIAKGAGKLTDINSVNKLDDAFKIFNETKQAIDTSTNTGRKALKKIEIAENILTKNNRKMDLLEEYKSKNNKNFITPENWKEQNFLQRAFDTDDVQLIHNKNSKQKQKNINNIIINNYSKDIQKINENLSIYDKVAKPLSNLIDEGVEELTEKQINIIAKKTGLSSEKSKYALQDYKKNIDRLETFLNKKEIKDSSLSSLQHFYKVDSINELLKTDNAIEELIKRDAENNLKLFKETAEMNNLKPSQFYDHIILYIETGNKGLLNEASVKVADKVKTTFEQLNDIDRAVLGNAAYVKDKKYIPRKIKSNTKEDLKKYKEYRLETSKSRTTRDKSFFEVRNELAEKELELENDLVELISSRTRTTKNRVKHSSLQEGVKKYRSPKAGKGLTLTDHRDLAVKSITTRTSEEFLRAIKGTIKEDQYEKIKNLNWNGIKKELPKLIGIKNAKQLFKKHGKKVAEQQSYLPNVVLAKLKPILYKNTDIETPLNKTLKGLSSYMQAWKKWTLAPIPSFHANSMIDNANILFTQSPESFLQTRNAIDILKGKDIILKTPLKDSKSINLEDLIEHGITGGKYSSAEFDKLPKTIAKTPFDKVKNFIKGDNALVDKGFEFGTKAEDLNRIMYALSELEKGFDIDDVSKSIKKIFYDPSEITEFVKSLRDYGMPFVSWFVDNVKKTPTRYGASIGRATMPLKAINTARADEEQFVIEDRLADGDFMFRTNRRRSMDLTPKFSQLDLLNVLSAIQEADNPIEGIVKKGGEYLGPYMGLIGAALNKDFRRDTEITRTAQETDSFLGMETDKRIIQAIKSQARIFGILDNIIKDENDNYLTDTISKYGAEKGKKALLSNLGYVLLGSSFTRDLERSGERSVRELGQKASAYEREAKKSLVTFKKEQDPQQKEKYKRLLALAKEERAKQKTIQKELPKLRKEQQKINAYVENKYQIPMIKDDLFSSIQKKADQTLSQKTEVELLEVLDGDSLKVKLPNGMIEYVRLAGVDSPEQEKAFQKNNVFSALSESDNLKMYQEAKETLTTLLKGNKFFIQQANKQSRDRYDRPVVKVTIPSYESGEIDINEFLIKKGLAKPAFLHELRDENYAEKLRKSSLEAQGKGVGFWDKIENKEYYSNLLWLYLNNEAKK